MDWPGPVGGLSEPSRDTARPEIESTPCDRANQRSGNIAECQYYGKGFSAEKWRNSGWWGKALGRCAQRADEMSLERGKDGGFGGVLRVSECITYWLQGT
jgi:hypothetical protein